MRVILFAGLAATFATAAEAVVLEDPFFYQEARVRDGGPVQQRLAAGVSLQPGSVNGEVSATFDFEAPVDEERVTTETFPEIILGGPVRDGMFASVNGGAAGGGVTITVTDDDGSQQVSLPATGAPNRPYLPVVSDVIVGPGNDPLIQWTNPNDADGLAALGVDYIRVRAISEDPFFNNSFIAVTDDLSADSFQFPDLFALYNTLNLLLRVELVDDRDGEAAPGLDISEFTVLTSYRFDEQSRSTNQVSITVPGAMAPVPVPPAFLLLGSAVLGFGLMRRRA